MVEIPLTRGKVAIIDDEDYELVSQYKWYAMKMGNGKLYAASKFNRRVVYMHRLLMLHSIVEVDHINGLTLDNRRLNLRVVTRSQNSMNKQKQLNSTSKYKGVCWHSRDRRWQARITLDNKTRSLGYFSTEEEAAQAYNLAASNLFGEYAKLNS